MSRSYKKSPVHTDGSAGSTKKTKRIANHTVRQAKFEEVPTKGKGYKKLFESYNIHDYIDFWTWEDAVDWWERNEYAQKRFPTKKDLYRYWYQISKAK